MKKSLKYHIADTKWPARTLCGKEFEGITGSPLNSDGSVAAERVGDDLEGANCRTCRSAWRKLTEDK